jgi:hypothetical protein
VLIDGQPRGRLATTAKTVERLRKTLAEVIGDAAATVADRAMVCETYGGAEAIIQCALPQRTPRDLALAAAIDAELAPVAAPAADPIQPPVTVDIADLCATSHPIAAANAASWPKGPKRRTNATAASQAAATGQMPTPPDFSAATHARFRGKLEGLIALAGRGDIDGLHAVAINPVSSSPKALARYRDLCIAALEARTGSGPSLGPDTGERALLTNTRVRHGPRTRGGTMTNSWNQISRGRPCAASGVAAATASRKFF